jgi:hypothetical protein
VRVPQALKAREVIRRNRRRGGVECHIAKDCPRGDERTEAAPRDRI